MLKLVSLLVLLYTQLSNSAPLKYCIQVATETKFEVMKPYFTKVKDFPEARIEKRGKFYLLRVGAEDRKENLYVVFRKIRSMFPDAFIKKCEIKEEYVVLSADRLDSSVEKKVTDDKEKPKALTKEPKKSQKLESEEEVNREVTVKFEKKTEKKIEDISIYTDKEIKELLISIKNELSIIRNQLKSPDKRSNKKNESEENPAYFEKFLYSVGIFTGGLFLFTWILMIMLYRKIGASNVENANLLNDMFKLIKVLNLLSKGHIIKMESGKLLTYDRKNERWREVD